MGTIGKQKKKQTPLCPFQPVLLFGLTLPMGLGTTLTTVILGVSIGMNNCRTWI